MNLHTKRFYKRYEFEAAEMDEREVADSYRRRFFTYEQVAEYTKGVLSVNPPKFNAAGRTIVIPTALEIRMIDTSDRKEFDWLDPNKTDPQPSGFLNARKNEYVPGFPEPSSNGILCIRDPTLPWYLELHRNGCIEHMREVGFQRKEKGTVVYLDYKLFALKLLHTLQFADMVYSRYNYFGDIRVVASIVAAKPLALPSESPFEERFISSNRLEVTREFSSTMLASDFSYVASGMMNELYNCFGLWRCPLFDDNGNYVKERFAA
jgi:hypothetical protein